MSLVTIAVDVKILEKICVDNRVLVSVTVISSWVMVIVIAWKCHDQLATRSNRNKIKELTGQDE